MVSSLYKIRNLWKSLFKTLISYDMEFYYNVQEFCGQNVISRFDAR